MKPLSSVPIKTPATPKYNKHDDGPSLGAASTASKLETPNLLLFFLDPPFAVVVVGAGRGVMAVTMVVSAPSGRISRPSRRWRGAAVASATATPTAHCYFVGVSSCLLTPSVTLCLLPRAEKPGWWGGGPNTLTSGERRSVGLATWSPAYRQQPATLFLHTHLLLVFFVLPLFRFQMGKNGVWGSKRKPKKCQCS